MKTAFAVLIASVALLCGCGKQPDAANAALAARLETVERDVQTLNTEVLALQVQIKDATANNLAMTTNSMAYLDITQARLALDEQRIAGLTQAMYALTNRPAFFEKTISVTPNGNARAAGGRR